MASESPVQSGCKDFLIDDVGLRAIEQLEAFRQISVAVGSKSDIYTVISLISDKTSQIMRAQRTSVFLLERDGNGVEYLKSIVADGCETIIMQLGQGIAGHCAKTRQRINVKDAYQSPFFDDSFDKRHGFETRSCLTSPIFDIDRNLVGVIQVINKCRGTYFSHVDEDMLDSICAQIGISLTQHRHYLDMIHKNTALRAVQESLQKRNAELDMLYELERKAASAPDLDELMRLMLNYCTKAFNLRVALAVVTDESGHRLYSVDTVGATNSSSTTSFDIKRLDRLPTFLSAVIRLGGECIRLSEAEIETLPKQSVASLGYSFRTLLIAPLVKDDDALGALILGSEICHSDVFTPGDAKLASIFAAHIAPSVRAHMTREADEKARRLTVIGQMMSAILHDMKTPLTNISGYVDFIVRQDEKEKREQLADVVTRQIDKITHMSAEILQFARGQSSVLLLPNDLHAIIAEAIELLRPESELRRIDLRCDERIYTKIACDADKIQRLIVNLARNAFEAIDHDGSVVISTYADETKHAICLAVEDDGPGIPKQISKNLFDAFVTVGKANGTGLGLSIVKKIVDEHDASIDWENVVPHGTKFVIAFRVPDN